LAISADRWALRPPFSFSSLSCPVAFVAALWQATEIRRRRVSFLGPCQLESQNCGNILLLLNTSLNSKLPRTKLELKYHFFAHVLYGFLRQDSNSRLDNAISLPELSIAQKEWGVLRGRIFDKIIISYILLKQSALLIILV